MCIKIIQVQTGCLPFLSICLVYWLPVLWSWIDLGCAKPPRSLILEDSSGLSRMKAKKECPFKQTSRAVHKNVHIDDDNANLSHTYCT